MAAGALTFGVDTVKWGIWGMSKVYEIVASATSVSMSALRTIFEGSSESDGRVFIETPDKSNRGRGSNSCNREKLRKLTPWHYKAIMNYIDWSNETRGQVCAAACAGGGWGRGEGAAAHVSTAAHAAYALKGDGALDHGLHAARGPHAHDEPRGPRGQEGEKK